MAIEHGKRGFFVNHKPFLYFGIGLNLNEQLDDEYVVHFMKVTMCAFCGGKFPPTWEFPTYMGMSSSYLHAHVSFLVCCGTFFYFHEMFGEGLPSGDASRLLERF